MATHKLIRFATVREITGLARSTIYLRISEGLFPPAVTLGSQSVAWPESEITAINAARIRGADEDQIRALVASLVAARKSAA